MTGIVQTANLIDDLLSTSNDFDAFVSEVSTTLLLQLGKGPLTVEKIGAAINPAYEKRSMNPPDPDTIQAVFSNLINWKRNDVSTAELGTLLKILLEEHKKELSAEISRR